jgi:hypothetical protein
MEELLQSLVENEILTDETKKELTEAITKQIEEAKDAAIVEAKAEVEAQVRVELTEQFAADKEALIEALDTKAEEYLKEEMSELRDDIENFRDLEVEMHEKLDEAKAAHAEIVKNDIEELVETIDSFLDMRITEEVKELKEDIEEAKRLQFGADIYEAFEAMFTKQFINENDLEDDLKDKEGRLADLESKLEEASTELAKATRKSKLDEVLASLTGRNKDVMEACLQNVPTEKLEEGYEHYIAKVLHESVDAVVESEKEGDESSSVLAEGEDSVEATSKEDIVTEGTVVSTGNTEQMIEESSQEDQVPQHIKDQISRLKFLAGNDS